METRLAEIETKLSFSEELLEALNGTVYRQQQQIDQLQRNCVPCASRCAGLFRRNAQLAG